MDSTTHESFWQGTNGSRKVHILFCMVYTAFTGLSTRLLTKSIVWLKIKANDAILLS